MSQPALSNNIVVAVKLPVLLFTCTQKCFSHSSPHSTCHSLNQNTTKHNFVPVLLITKWTLHISHQDFFTLRFLSISSPKCGHLLTNSPLWMALQWPVLSVWRPSHCVLNSSSFGLKIPELYPVAPSMQTSYTEGNHCRTLTFYYSTVLQKFHQLHVYYLFCLQLIFQFS